MDLEQYRRKRDFGRTPEPAAARKESMPGHLFVIHKHDASRLHYDLRLELDGVLKSWAVPKGPSLDPDDRRLAVHVEDHPLEYGGFEGVIPAGQYGGGTVMLWDRGQWEPLGDPRKGYQKGHLSFRLHGEKLRGEWTLARMGGKAAEEDKYWLFIKKRDDKARRRIDHDLLTAEPLSVASGRTLAEIAETAENGPGENIAFPVAEKGRGASQDSAQGRQNQAKALSDTDPSRLPGARAAPPPATITPQMASLVEAPPSGDDWLHEIKYDGYRLSCFISSNGQVRLMTRNRKDWTEKFAQLTKAIRERGFSESVLDGEVVVLLEDGTTDFQGLQNILKGNESGDMVYYLFDIPYYRGYDLCRTPLWLRKQLLRRLLREMAPRHPTLRYSEHIRGNGDIVLEHACRLNLEGIICKRADSGYLQKRSRSWLKVKCLLRQEFVVGGYTDPGGSRFGFGALLLGYHDEQARLVHAGRVGTGFNERMLREMSRELQGRERQTASFVNPPVGREARGVHWTEPDLVAEIEFSGWTREGMLRHPVFKGLRDDKDPQDVVLERPQPLEELRKPKEPPTSAIYHKKIKDRAGTIRLTNPERVLYPGLGITKEDLANFYEQIGAWILPHLLRRPLTLYRCPQGYDKGCFYQKHLEDSMPVGIKGVVIEEKGKRETYIYIEDLAGLISLVQLGTLEFHPWGARMERVERPDRMIFDLDPGEQVSWWEVITGARLLRERLAELGLESFLKTTGGKGLHVVVPLVRRSGWEEVKTFAKAVADEVAQSNRTRYLTTMSKAKRRGKVYIDYLRNSRGATAIGPYSTRARAGAPVSTPLGWDELSSELAADSFTIHNLPQRLAQLKSDPWATMKDVRQSITKAMRQSLKLT